MCALRTLRVCRASKRRSQGSKNRCADHATRRIPMGWASVRALVEQFGWIWNRPMSEYIFNITMDNAKQVLIDESFQRPVVVDFWAEWCAPCKTLMPLLEKIANEYAGQFVLAKVNCDEEQQIAQQFGVRNLPTVMVMKDGQPVDGFVGAQTETAVRELLEKFLPKPWDLQLQ